MRTLPPSAQRHPKSIRQSQSQKWLGQAPVRSRHVAAAAHGDIPVPLFGGGSDGVPIGGQCQHRVGRDQSRRADVIINIPRAASLLMA
jgi:hypothetical protein